MSGAIRLPAMLLAAGLLVGGTAQAAPVEALPCRAAAPTGAKLVVGTVSAPPFVIEHDDGSWGGITIELWRAIADELQLDYEIRELTRADLDDARVLDKLDVIIPVHVTEEYEARFDLTHSFYASGLSIATPAENDDGVLHTVRAFLSVRFLMILTSLFAVLLVTGLAMWAIERRRNSPEFGGTPTEGIGAGVWWSAVTMTTIGYGDVAPKTVAGRLLALVWMFTALVMTSTFTAAIASSLTVHGLGSRVAGPQDLHGVRVGTVAPSPGVKYLARRRIAHHDYPDVEAAIAALANGELDAVVGEAPVLRYEVHRAHGAKLRVLDGTFDNHGYAIGLGQCSSLREPMDLALLHIVASDEWEAILHRYLGAE